MPHSPILTTCAGTPSRLHRAFPWAALALAVAACTAAPTDRDTDAGDSDPDSDAPAETDTDTDLPADTDEDGLSDGEEAALGTDPADPDSDDDGYLDGDEVAEGADPLDATNGIYAGGWPYCRAKAALDDATGDEPEVGARFRRLKLEDHLGQDVDLYDFGCTDAPVVVEVYAAWCPECKVVADLLLGRPNELAEAYPHVADEVTSGRVRWVELLIEDADGQPATVASAKAWHDAYPVPGVPVLVGNAGVGAYGAPGLAYPTIWLLDGELNVILSADGDSGPTLLDWIEARATARAAAAR